MKKFALFEESDLKHYSFVNNLKQIHRQTTDLLKLGDEKLSELAEKGDWADDHLSVAAEDLEQVYDWIMDETKLNELNKSTYFSAAAKLYGKGHGERSEKMKDHAKHAGNPYEIMAVNARNKNDYMEKVTKEVDEIVKNILEKDEIVKDFDFPKYCCTYDIESGDGIEAGDGEKLYLRLVFNTQYQKPDKRVSVSGNYEGENVFPVMNRKDAVYVVKQVNAVLDFDIYQKERILKALEEKLPNSKNSKIEKYISDLKNEIAGCKAFKYVPNDIPYKS